MSSSINLPLESYSEEEPDIQFLRERLRSSLSLIISYILDYNSIPFPITNEAEKESYEGWCWNANENLQKVLEDVQSALIDQYKSSAKSKERNRNLIYYVRGFRTILIHIVILEVVSGSKINASILNGSDLSDRLLFKCKDIISYLNIYQERYALEKSIDFNWVTNNYKKIKEILHWALNFIVKTEKNDATLQQMLEKTSNGISEQEILDVQNIYACN